MTSAHGSQRLERFGAQAANTTDVVSLLTSACQEIADALGVSHVKALEYHAEERKLLIRAGIGWADHVVGEALVPAGLESAAGFTLETGKPTTCDDLTKETRFHVPELLREHKIKSAANVLIKAGDYTYGVLEADNNKLRIFSEEDVNTLQGFANILALVVTQVKLSEHNRALSDQKELLLNELLHRTKNNNQMLMSIVGLQRSKSQVPLVREALDEVENRISLLSSVDTMLSMSHQTADIDTPPFISGLAGKIFTALSSDEKKPRLVLDLEDCTLSRRRCQAIAIIINEFITNSFKHAFERDGRLQIVVKVKDESIIVTLSDDGPGFAEDASPGLGLHIIDATAKQIGAELEWSHKKGSSLTLVIPRHTDHYP